MCVSFDAGDMSWRVGKRTLAGLHHKREARVDGVAGLLILTGGSHFEDEKG